MPESFLYSIEDFDLKDQKVFIRTDFNVPVRNGQVEDHLRLRACVPTIQYALQNQAHVIIGSHRGRPTMDNKKDLSLEPFGYYLGEKLKCEVLFIDNLKEKIPTVLLSSLNEKKIMLLENLRFYPEEEKAEKTWTEHLASYVDIYINDAFSVSHRKHASVYTLPLKLKQKGQGFSLKKERETLDYIREKPGTPFVLMVGGVKVSDKIAAISALIDRVDTVLIGGLMAYTFLKVKGIDTGEAFIQKESMHTAEEFMNRLESRGKKILLPIDHVVLPSDISPNDTEKLHITKGPELPTAGKPVDIGPKTIKLFSTALQTASTVFWNGPLGWFEQKPFDKGTMEVCSALARCENAFRVIGGGDSISAVLKSGFTEQFNYISTGGGAALKYLEKGHLPGIQSLITYN